MSHAARRQCPTPSKQQFRAAEAAVSQLRRLRDRGRAEDEQVYHCCCGQWHVGHLTAALRRRIHRALARTA